MNDVTPPADPRLAFYSRLGDPGWLRRQGLFVAEGRLVVERLIQSGRFAIESILVTPAARRALSERLDPVDIPVFVVDAETMNQMTGFNFHRGCLALARRPVMPSIEPWLQHEGMLLALEGVGNPDNVGGLFRTAAAFGAIGILLDSSTADPLYRKAIRTSMGAALQLPWVMAESWIESIIRLRAEGWRIAALTPHAGATAIQDFASRGYRRVVLLLGAEGPGLSDATLAAADDRVRIAIAPGIDSLNVTVAAGIALHALGVVERSLGQRIRN